MSQPLINDAIAMLRMQFKPLDQYQYPASHLLLGILALGVTAAAGAPSGMGEPLNLVLFFSLYIGTEIWLLSRFMHWWLQRGGMMSPPALLGTLVVASAIQVLEPLSSWLPDDMAMIANMTISLASVWITVCALAFGSQQARRRIVLGMLLFTPLALALSFLMISSATNMGLVNIPQELKAAIEQQQEQNP